MTFSSHLLVGGNALRPQRACLRGSEKREIVDSEWISLLAPIVTLTSLWSSVDLRLGVRAAAQRLSYSSTAELQRWLRSHDLPPYQPLRDVYYVVRLCEEAASGQSLAAWCLSRGRDPASYYRFIQRACGKSWGEISQIGLVDQKAEAIDLIRGGSNERSDLAAM